MRALELGAIDFVAKPSSGIDLDMSSVREELVRKLRTGLQGSRRAQSGALGAGQGRAGCRSGSNRRWTILPAHPRSQEAARMPLAVLAASTGGPATLMKLVAEFAADFPGAVLVVQHMPGSFTPQFAEQLAAVSQLPVKQAENGETLRAGQVYVCPGDRHLRVAPPGRIVLDDGPRIAGYRPSIDVTLESVAALAGVQRRGRDPYRNGQRRRARGDGNSGKRRTGDRPG